ncbi:MAG: ribonuclease HII [Flavobacteriales bacterium]|nr:ribonuclease HII [Flavobacteriales bacterium]MBL6873168.1 ribonuclease HII [Flavobacteriales bacterium]
MLKPFYKKGLIEAGCDEAGRGCLAGPVVAASVILPPKIKLKGLNDSKLLSHKKRIEFEPIIKEQAIEWAIGIVAPEEIDEINILNASFLAMHRAINQLKTKIDLLLIDGNRFNKHETIKHECIVKGDSKFLSIAAASVLAKNYRDEIMVGLDKKYPIYDWKNNKGYPTKKHRQAILVHGITEHHRKSFQLIPLQYEIEF